MITKWLVGIAIGSLSTSNRRGPIGLARERRSLRRLAHVPVQIWNYRGSAPGLVNHHRIVKIFVLEVVPVVGRRRDLSAVLGVCRLGGADGMALELSEGIGREKVQIIVGEAALRICVSRHAARSASGAA
jgi:hypothetical protein